MATASVVYHFTGEPGARVNLNFSVEGYDSNDSLYTFGDAERIALADALVSFMEGQTSLTGGSVVSMQVTGEFRNVDLEP